MDLQELVAKGRFIFRRAEGRLKVFALVDGRRTAKAIAKRTQRSQSSVLHDLKKLADFELIRPRLGKDGSPTKKDASFVFEKAPLARQIPIRYFRDTPTSTRRLAQPRRQRPRLAPGVKPRPLHMPREDEALTICQQGEDDTHEFKGPGTDIRKVTKEIAAFLHTRAGGILLYGVQDDGTIAGTDLRRADFDQRLQNSLRNTIKPAPTVRIRSVNVLGTEILAVVVPPWNRRDVYFYEGRAYVRKGTNVFEATHEEIRKLHQRRSI